MDRVSEWAERRTAPVVATVVMLVLVMTYSLLAHSVFHVGTNTLRVSERPLEPGRLARRPSCTATSAQIYVRHGALTSPPALEFVLVPVVALGQLLGLSPHLRVQRPAAQLVVRRRSGRDPAGIDGALRHRHGRALVAALRGRPRGTGVGGRARRRQRGRLLGTSRGLRRPGLRGLGGVGDGALRSARRADEPRSCWASASRSSRWPSSAWRRCWLVSAGAPRPRLWWRLVLPSLVVLVPPLLAETHDTLFVLVRQPFQPRYISFTPLTALAHRLGPGLDGGGMTRLVAIVVASASSPCWCAIAATSLPTVLALVAVAFFLRIRSRPR